MQGPFKTWYEAFSDVYRRMGFLEGKEPVDVVSIDVGARPQSRMSPFPTYADTSWYVGTIENEYHISDGVAFDFARMIHNVDDDCWYYIVIEPFTLKYA